MKIKELLKAFWSWLNAEISADISDAIDIDGNKPDAGDGGLGTDTEEPPKSDSDGAPFDRLNWCYGGFDGSQSSPVDGVEIVLDSVTPAGLLYHFEEGTLSALSASNSHDNPDCLACLFCLRGVVWRGGKFDWISSDRLTRDFHNIESGYNGWPTDSIKNANAYAFVIVSKDGKKRTNVAYALKED